jgi:hypothetical protein
MDPVSKFRETFRSLVVGGDERKCETHTHSTHHLLTNKGYLTNAIEEL